MEAKLTINGVDFIPYCKEDGIQQKSAIRRSRSVTATDGTLYEKKITKRHLTVNLVRIRDSTLMRLAAALKSPATVTYTDMQYGDLTKVFLASAPQATEKTVQGGNTYFSGVSFTLEER